jgi:Cys-tRNA(Pro)/Cys-tRNA(Cys) deacylase
MENKTNVMRILDKAKIEYKVIDYHDKVFTNANNIAVELGLNPEQEFKTLVTIGKSKNYYVFVVPSSHELDLKKAAKVVDEKNLEMIPFKDLLSVTGYIHGGCSPIGLKKPYTITINKTATNFETIIFSAGKVGYSVEVKNSDLPKVIKYSYADIIKD